MREGLGTEMEVTLKNLTKKFPGRDRKKQEDVIAVNDFTFQIPDGKLIGLLGPSGCGKSTTLNLISGLLKPTDGKIFLGKMMLRICRRKTEGLDWYFKIMLFIHI